MGNTITKKLSIIPIPQGKGEREDQMTQIEFIGALVRYLMRIEETVKFVYTLDELAVVCSSEGAMYTYEAHSPTFYVRARGDERAQSASVDLLRDQRDPVEPVETVDGNHIMVPVYSEDKNAEGGYDIIAYKKEYI